MDVAKFDHVQSPRSDSQFDKTSETGDVESQSRPPQVSYALAVEQFRDIFHSSASSKALERIRKELKENEHPNPMIIRFLTEGSVAFNTSLFSFWYNLAVIAVFLGIVSASIAVGYTGRNSGFNHTKNISAESYEGSAQAYYVLWAISAVVQFSALSLVLLSSAHYRMMLHEDDMVWYLISWNFFIYRLPLLLVVFGCLTATAGIVLGVILTADVLATSVVAGISGLLLVLILILWMFMNANNQFREQEALSRIRHALLKKV